MEYHEAADIFPLMTGAEYDALVDDIREHGLREPIWTYKGKIIDGRNRYRACNDVGIRPTYREWDGNGSLVSFVVSLNLHRRHLNESQRDMVAAKIANLSKGGDRRSETFKAPIGALISQSDAAQLLNVSERGIQRAKQVLNEGIPELVAAVEQGQVAVSTAALITELPKEEQTELVARGKDEILRVAKEIRKEANKHVSDDSYEWYTPPEYIEAARKVMGSIDLDPASCAEANTKIGAPRFFTINDNGIDQEWEGNVWLNPPYNMPWIERFADKLLESLETGKVCNAIMLTNNATDTGWFHRLLQKSLVCFTRGRVKFWGPEDAGLGARQGQALFYFGPNQDTFSKTFNQFGVVVSPLEPYDNREPGGLCS